MKYGRVGLSLLMAFALGACVFVPQALADSNARIVRLSYVDGEVQMDRRDGRGFEHAFLNMPLAPGTQVTTRDDGRAEIEFEDMSTVRLAPDTLVETQSLDLRSTGSKYTLVDLQDGTAYFNIRKRDDDNDFRVSTGQREFSLTRASRFRLRVDHKQVVLSVFSGEVEITDEKGRLTVRKNETLTLDLDDPSRYFLAKGVDQDRYDDWDRERDEYRDRYANQGSYRGYSSAYSYGVADLNYWGNYTYISGYGQMWRPHYYGIGWNPYSNGGWYWYPGSGFIWVSAYPWGWMPFRYGSWYYIGGHGWCWRPGRQWNRWSPVVAVHNPPAGHVVPTPPPPTGRRDPVIVGRGPTTILPPEDPGPGRGRRDPDALGRRGGNPTGGGTGVAGAPGVGSGAGSGGATSGGSGVTAGSGSGVSTGSGGSGRPAADSRGGRGSGPVREVDLEDAIHNARERRSGGGQPVGGQHGGVITNSGPGSSAPSSGSLSPSSGGSGSGAAAQDSSPTSGRQRVPESRRMLPESVTRDSSTPASSPGSSGSASSGRSSGNGSGSGATAPSVERTPYASGGRSSELRGETPRGSYQPSSGPSASAPSGSAGSGSSPASSGASGGSSGRSSYAPSAGSGGGGTSVGSSASSSSGRSSGGGSASGAGRSSSGTGSSSSGARSSASTTPK